MRAIAAWHHQFVWVDLLQQVQGLEVFDDLLAGIETIQAAVFDGHFVIEARVFGQDVDHRQVVALADGVVVEVVGGRDLDAAAAEVWIDVVVGDDRDHTACQRQGDLFADQVLVTLVVRVYGHRGVAEHGLRTGGGDDDVAAAVGEWVFEVPHVAVFFLRDDLEVGDGGVQYGVPVDQALAAVDQAFFVQADEDFAHGVRQAFVHREAFFVPVQ